MAVDGPRAADLQDEEVRLRLVAGDDAVLAEVYDRYAASVYGLALRVTADAEAARDVTQEVFAGLWERPLAFDPGRGSLHTWLGVVAHRRAVDWVRRDVRHRRAAETPLAPGHGPAVDEEVIADDVARTVRKAAAALSTPLRDVIELAYFRGHTYRRVAELLDIPEGTVKSRIRRALTLISEDLEREGVTR